MIDAKKLKWTDLGGPYEAEAGEERWIVARQKGGYSSRPPWVAYTHGEGWGVQYAEIHAATRREAVARLCAALNWAKEVRSE